MQPKFNPVFVWFLAALFGLLSLTVVAVVFAEDVTLAWSAPTDPLVTHTNVYRRTVTDSAFVRLDSAITDTTYTTTLPDSGAARYYVTAGDGWGRESPPSDTVHVSRLLAPAGLRVQSIQVILGVP
jgi:hypothetical protein